MRRGQPPSRTPVARCSRAFDELGVALRGTRYRVATSDLRAYGPGESVRIASPDLALAVDALYAASPDEA